MDGKSGANQYVTDCQDLLASMQQHGFSLLYPIPVDPNTELLNGSHRLACALALGIETVPVECRAQHVQAPAWDCEWFVKHGMDRVEIARLVDDWQHLAAGDAGVGSDDG
ncbi:MAG: ParB/RepB/Spo0J family partition protein [bacterium]